MLKSSKTLQNRVCPNYPIECVPSFEPKTFWSHFTKEFEQFFENLRKYVDFRESSMQVRCTAQALIFWRKMRKDLGSGMSYNLTLMWTVRTPHGVVRA